VKSELLDMPRAAASGEAVAVPAIARRTSVLWTPSAAGTACEVMGHRIANVMLADAATILAAAASLRRKTRVVFVNAHVATSAAADPGYREVVRSADIRFADGSGLALAARMCGEPLADNVNGTDMLPLLARAAMRTGVRIYLLGGVPGAAARSAETLARLGLGAALAGTHHGYFERGGAAEAAVIDDINRSGAGILLVGFGVPLQDQWLAANSDRLQVPVLIGVGGLFDFFSGRVSRAPAILRTLGLEWTWRLALEPGRMWRRYLIGNAVFLWHAARFAAIRRLRSLGRAPLDQALSR